jgi:hypothetical protein
VRAYQAARADELPVGKDLHWIPNSLWADQHVPFDVGQDLAPVVVDAEEK